MIMGFIWKWALVSVVFMIVAAMLPSVKVRSWSAAIGAALVFGVANSVLGWLLSFVAKAFLFLPNILSLGLIFLFIPFAVNAVLVKLTDVVVEEDLEIEGLGGLMGTAVAVTAASAIASGIAS
jgi:uncharacterized membrane protein YvlD (DUF360 family)